MTTAINPLTGDFFILEAGRANSDASDLIFDRTFGEDAGMFKCVYNNTSGVALLGGQGSLEVARVIGITLEPVLNGEEGRVLRLGFIESADFSSFTNNDTLYLGNNGNITNIPPAVGSNLYETEVGIYYGSNSALIDIKEPFLRS